MSVYRQGPRTFTEIYFSMHHGTILCGNVYIYIYTHASMGEKESRKRGWKGTRIESLEARVFKKKKGEDRRLGVSPRTRWPRGENKSRFCVTLDTHYIFLNIARQDTRVITYVVRLHTASRCLTSTLVGEDTSVIFHPREMHRSADVYRYLFPGSSLCNGDSAVLTQSISFGDSGSWYRERWYRSSYLVLCRWRHIVVFALRLRRSACLFDFKWSKTNDECIFDGRVSCRSWKVSWWNVCIRSIYSRRRGFFPSFFRSETFIHICICLKRARKWKRLLLLYK